MHLCNIIRSITFFEKAKKKIAETEQLKIMQDKRP